MSHTNSTTNYALPQFVTTDKPAWLTDINGAFSDLDTAVKAAKDAGDNAQNDATQALSDASTADGKATTADAKASGALASIESTFDPTTVYAVGTKVIYNSLLYVCTVAVTTPGPWTGSTNWSRLTVDGYISDTATTLQGNIDALSLATSYVPGTVSLHTGLSGTLTRGYVGKQGRICVLDALVTVSGAVSAGTTLLDLSSSVSAANTTDIYGTSTDGSAARFYIANNTLVVHTTIPAGSYVINACYTSAS